MTDDFHKRHQRRSLPREHNRSRQPSASQEGCSHQNLLCLDLQPPGLWKIKVCCISYTAYDILLCLADRLGRGLKHHIDSGLSVPDSPAWAQDTRCSLPRLPNVQLRLGESESVIITVMQVLPTLCQLFTSRCMELGAFIYKQESTTTNECNHSFNK